jgi:type II secretory pathway component HofQ
VNIWVADDVNDEVTIKVRNVTVNDVVDQLCRDRGLHCQRNDNVILVSHAAQMPTHPYFGKRIDVDFTDQGKPVDLRVAIAAVARAAQVKIEVADDVQATLSMRGRDMPWDQVLDIVLWLRGLRAERQGDVIHVTRWPALLRTGRAGAWCSRRRRSGRTG